MWAIVLTRDCWLGSFDTVLHRFSESDYAECQRVFCRLKIKERAPVALFWNVY